MIRWQTWVLAGLASSLLSSLAACGGGSIGGEDDPEKGPLLPGGSCEQAQVGAPVLRRLTALELENSLRDIFPELGATWSGVRLGTDPTSDLGFTNDAQALQVGVQTAKELLSTAEEVADIVTADAALATSLPCAATQPGPECAAEFVTRHGLRLFRRPVSDEEKSEFLSLHASVSGKSDFRRGLKWTLVSMIQSPYAFYRSEIGAPSAGVYTLSQHELATALAYNYTGTTPTPELLDKAARGELGSPEALVEEARALLSTPRGHEAMSRFSQQWLSYGKVNGIAKEKIPDFSTYGSLMQEETRLFLEEVIYTRGAGVTELLTAPYTFLNAQLSTFYGYGNVTGQGFQLVERPAEWSVGLLAQGSLLAGNSRMDSSSPTHRGLLVFERLLCGHMPPPPANIPAITKPDPGRTTTRARYEDVHISAEACNVCHQKMDPTGFALEHFDEMGRYRADEGGLTIDDSGYIAVGAEERPVVGAKGLAETLASSPEVHECVSELASAYTYGGALGAECAIGEIQQGLVSGQIGLLEFFARLAGTEHMRTRVRRE
ncbi:DUF1592 domain-containing protein [Sorangium sp. So ce1078]|uniref:DUF1592 domain-containing protein n=1 Tax=Sorangium sp. So ce1078 TaxID=3133329 RepID=UPI003F5FA4B1